MGDASRCVLDVNEQRGNGIGDHCALGMQDTTGAFPSPFDAKKVGTLCANIGETSCPSTITVGRGKKSHLDEHKQDKYFFRCVGSFGA
jgi:hypothetical protein